MICGAAVGGGYDALARLLARHLNKHIPGNPTIVVQNQPAAGSLVTTNQIYGNSPKDGTVIALIQRGMLTSKLINPSQTRFEVEKLNWLGSMASEVGVALSWHTDSGQDREGTVREGADCRRSCRRRSGDDATSLQRGARHQIQDHSRL